MNCPHCGAGKKEGFVIFEESQRVLCRRCGLGMGENGVSITGDITKGRHTGKKGYFEKVSRVLFAVFFAATVILIVIGMAYSIPGYPSAMFRTDRVAKIALAEQSKIWHSVFQK